MNIIFKDDCIENDETKEKFKYTEIDAKSLYVLINMIMKESSNLEIDSNEPIAQKMFDIFRNEFKEKDNIV